DWIARQIRDNFPAGRRVYLEEANEPWNFQIDDAKYINKQSQLLYPGQDILGWDVARVAAIQAIFQRGFCETGRGGELKSLINRNKWDAGNMIEVSLDFGRANGCVPDYVTTAPYNAWGHQSSNPVTFAYNYSDNEAYFNYFWTLDDDQAVSFWINE